MRLAEAGRAVGNELASEGYSELASGETAEFRLMVEGKSRDLNPILRGWGTYFRTGNATAKFDQIDRYVVWRLKRLLIKKRGRNIRAGQVAQWSTEWFRGQGLHRLGGTIRYPKAA